MLDAIKRGELPVSAKEGASQAVSQEQSNPNWHTKIAREALKSWAQGLGHSPRFLQKWRRIRQSSPELLCRRRAFLFEEGGGRAGFAVDPTTLMGSGAVTNV